jgi:hypothetical protein
MGFTPDFLLIDKIYIKVPVITAPIKDKKGNEKVAKKLKLPLRPMNITTTKLAPEFIPISPGSASAFLVIP